MSTTQIGDLFRDQVAELLRAAGYEATTETLEDHKRIDVLFEHTTFGKRRRYALEAKNWAKPLDRTDLERIYAGHASFVITRKIDELLVVSPHELRSPAAKAYIRETPGVSHLSFQQFQESLMGFRDYLSAFVYHHQKTGLEDYFIDPVLDNGLALEDHIVDWIETGTQPIAIIASYGMGKTSFARHLCYKFATRYLDGEPCRVPVLISLGAISREQSLEGLVASSLTAHRPYVSNYNFPLFDRLNALGRLLILLDGFDEMKHMMTWSEFQSNSDEVGRLVTGEAKIILLGRPTVFLSDDERSYVLRGRKKIGPLNLQSPGSPEYVEIRLRSFSHAQVQAFIHGYLSHHRRAGNINVTDDFIQRRQKEINQEVDEALISRPIHAQMLADIATDPTIDISGIGRFALYDYFIDYLVKREAKKPGRSRLYTESDRRPFLCDLAWYLWMAPSAVGSGCRMDDLPDALFEPYMPIEEDIRSVKRDLLSGSLLDEKVGGTYFFSHRSFLEFLVAEFIWNEFVHAEAVNEQEIDSMEEWLTPEVFEFLKERDDRSFFETFSSVVNKSTVAFSHAFWIMIGTFPRLRNIAYGRTQAFFSKSDAAVMIVSVLHDRKKGDRDAVRELSRALIQKAGKKPAVLMCAVRLLMAFGAHFGWEARVLIPVIVLLLLGRAGMDLREMARERKRSIRIDDLGDVVFAGISGKFGPGGDLRIVIDFGELYGAIGTKVYFPMVEEDLSSGFWQGYEISFEECFSEVEPSERNIAREFYRRDAAADRVGGSESLSGKFGLKIKDLPGGGRGAG